MRTERFDTVVIGAGQAGLSAGYHLLQAQRSFVIVDAGERVGDSWRARYDSLRLFTPARYVSLPGLRYSGSSMPARDEMADYLETYAATLRLPVRMGIHVDSVHGDGDAYVVTAGDHRFEAANVIVASGAHREARVPSIAHDLDPAIAQLHSTEYRNLAQLREGDVLVVGAGNSGADISLEAVGTHATWLSGPEHGHVPFDIDTAFARSVAFPIVRFIGSHVLTLRTPLGRKARAAFHAKGDPLVRVKPKQLLAAGVQRVGRTVGSRDGAPVLDDGQVLADVTNVIWCTGFRHDLSWIDLPIFGEDGTPTHERGVVTSEPGLYFVGLPFQYAATSDVLPGVGRDAAYVVKMLLRRSDARLETGTAAVAS
ncbi:MAG: NAD(P)-binding domain-containing protein [Actinomycetota bacterium]